MPPSITYRKLSGRNSVSYQRLYQADDHLLVADGIIQESYRRFYFKDIRAMIVGKSVRGVVYNTALPLIALSIGSFVFTGTVPAVIVGGIWLGIFFLILLVNLIKGPTSNCYIVTAVQTYRIASLGRLFKARKVIEQITPLIQAAQADRPDRPDASQQPASPDSRWAPPGEESA